MVRRLLRLAVGGLAFGLAVYGGGLLLERVVLGRNASAIAARTADETRETIRAMAESLQTAAASVSAAPSPARAVVADDPDATADLFAWTERARGNDTAVTVYSAAAAPVAWSGRPSELAPDL